MKVAPFGRVAIFFPYLPTDHVNPDGQPGRKVVIARVNVPILVQPNDFSQSPSSVLKPIWHNLRCHGTISRSPMAQRQIVVTGNTFYVLINKTR